MKKMLLGILMAIQLGANASAAIVTSVETDIAAGDNVANEGLPYTPTFSAGGPSTTDLLHAMIPTECGGIPTRFCTRAFTREDATGVAALTDGSVTTFYGLGDPFDNHTAYATGGADPISVFGGGETVTYSLAEATDIGEIVIYGGWNDGGRDQQHYDLLVSTDAGATFNIIGSIDVNPGIYEGPLGPDNDTSPVSTRVAFTDDNSPLLAAGVTDIRINFLAVEHGYSGYTEIDVFLAVPEPSSVALACCVGLLTVARRRSASYCFAGV